MFFNYSEIPQEYREEVKRVAYTIDPGCWESYSGQPKEVKRSIDHCRSAALDKAARQFEMPLEE